MKSILSIYCLSLLITIYLSLMKTKNIPWRPFTASIDKIKSPSDSTSKIEEKAPSFIYFFEQFWLCGSKKNFSVKMVGFKPVFWHHNRLEFNTTGFYREGTFKVRLSNYSLSTSLLKIAGVKTLLQMFFLFKKMHLFTAENKKNYGKPLLSRLAFFQDFFC